MFYRERTVSLPTLALSPFLASPQLLSVKDLPFRLVSYKTLVDVHGRAGRYKKPKSVQWQASLRFLFSLWVGLAGSTWREKA